MNIDYLIRLMDQNNIASPSDLVGVSEKEIKKFEKKTKLSLPAAYKSYLTQFGRSAGMLSTWMAIYFDDLDEIKEAFETINTMEESAIELAENALLITQMGTYFDYILCGESDDPSVYRIELNNRTGAFCEKCAEKFSAYLEQLILNAHQDSDHLQKINISEEGDVFEKELELGFEFEVEEAV